jgi:small subunit ribosomal protein S18
MYVDYKDLDLLGKLTNRQGKIVGRRKSGCTAASQHAVTLAVKRARFMALLPYVGNWAPRKIAPSRHFIKLALSPLAIPSNAAARAIGRLRCVGG